MTIVKTFPVIGIGASAGGLEALKSLFADLAPDTNAAYIVISHLDPKGTSMTAEILARHTAIPVEQATDNCAIEADHVYVIPPNAYLTISDYTLRLTDITLHHGLRLPVDVFFESLAAELGRNAVGVILSGTGSDGSVGVQAIANQGGLVIVQTPESAAYDGMPNSAINTGTVDIICPIEQLSEHLGNLLRNHLVAATDTSEREPQSAFEAATLQAIAVLLVKQTGADFSHYRPGTMTRRIARRMAIHYIDTPEQYLAFLKEDPKEPEALFKDLLIGVTEFFRDKDAFEALDKEVITELVSSKSTGDVIRVWIPGCASGEEAYSIAILLMEQLEKSGKYCEIRVFASDIDEHALSTGRTGLYSKNRMVNVSKQRLKRFFTEENSDYRVKGNLRSTITFANQNIISDPPFSKLDLISLRNVLIYLSPATQRNILTLCHFSLENNGFLFLGTAETLGQQANLFIEVNKKWRIYRKSQTAKPSARELALTYPKPANLEQRLNVIKRPSDQAHWKDLVQHELLKNYAPASALVTASGEVLYFCGPTSQYLNQPAGAPTQDLLLMVPHELREQIRAGLKQALSSRQVVNIEKTLNSRDDRHVRLDLVISPVASPRREDLLLVTFEEHLPVAANPVLTADDPRLDRISPADASLIQQLRQELDRTQAQLRDSLLGHECATEELQAANEETTSINEELQSSNEELESSKEELQSMNEELVTMNSELRESVASLAEANDSLANFIGSTQIATLFLDKELKIGRFTRECRRLLNLIDTDEGRPISDIRLGVHDSKLIDDAKDVLKTLKPVEVEVITDNDRYYMRRILPYRSAGNEVIGTVITYIDITDRKKADEQTRLLATVLRDSNDAIILQDMDGNITGWNRGAHQMYGWSERAALAMHMTDMVPEDEVRQHEKYMADIKAGTDIPSFETQRLTASGHILDAWITITPISDEHDTTCGFASTERDITRRKSQEKAISDAWKSEADTAERSRFLAIASHDLRQPLQSLGLLNSALQKTNKDSEAQRLLKMQQATLVDMRWLLDSLLDTSNLDKGNIAVRKQNLAVLPILERLHAELATEARQKGLELTIAASDDIGYTDPGLLSQLIRNLVGNAIRYTNKGSIKLACETIGKQLQFSVSDTGIGIPADQQALIFDEFHQLPQDKPEDRQGLGLGLAIVARIAKLLDTRIKVQSDVGHGSVFSFRIPVGKILPDADSTETAEMPGVTDTNTDTPTRAELSHYGAKILVIEDEPSVLDATGIRLSLEGFQVTPAATPEQALAAIEQHIPDLIITDQVLGHELTGVDLVRKIRATIGQPIPAIVVTGDTSLSADQINLEHSQLIRKPLKAEELLVVVAQSLES